METAVKEKPILFSGPMVRAILDGRKTQTRRIVKPQPELSDSVGFIHTDRKGKRWATGIGSDFAETCRNFMSSVRCPYGKHGERLWVRENFSLVNPLTGCEFNGRPENDGVRYQATWTKSHHSGWKPSIHMPRWASRLTLEITGIRVERLQDITESDACDEGWPGQSELIDKDPDSPYHGATKRDWIKAGMGDCENSIVWYADLWDEINGDGAWESNPWVWAVSFQKSR